MKSFRFKPAGLAVALACAAGTALAAPSLQDAARVLGAEQAKRIEFSGTGRWFQFGQAPAPDTPWPPFEVKRYVADLNYETGAARVQISRIQVKEPPRERPVPVEQRVDQYVRGTTAWNLPVNPPAGSNAGPASQPAAVEERQAEIIGTPQGFLRAALANHARATPVKKGLEVSFTVDGRHRYVGTLDANSELTSVKTWISNPVLGDTLVETRFFGYKDFGGVRFPGIIERYAGGYPILDLQVAEVKANVPVDIAVPDAVANAPVPPVLVKADKVAEGVYYLTGGTHHSVAIGQRDHVVVVEAPLNEERSRAVIAKTRELFPGKPIRYLINTHAHFDHSGGLRTFVAEGATIVTHEGNKGYYQKVWAAPRKLEPDALAQSRKPVRFETFSGRHVISDGSRTIEVHPISESGHNDAFALIWLPQEKILIEADAYTPTGANVPAAAPANPYSVNLLGNIQALGLDVKQILALHGPRVVTLDDLRDAVRQK